MKTYLKQDDKDYLFFDSKKLTRLRISIIGINIEKQDKDDFEWNIKYALENGYMPCERQEFMDYATEQLKELNEITKEI